MPRDHCAGPGATNLTKGTQVAWGTLQPGAGGMRWDVLPSQKAKILPGCVPAGSSAVLGDVAAEGRCRWVPGVREEGRVWGSIPRSPWPST